MNSYCVKCKAKRTMANPSAKHASNGRPMVTGSCNTCGSKMCTFVSEAQLKEGGFLGLLGKLFGLGVQLPGTQGRGKKKSHGTRN